MNQLLHYYIGETSEFLERFHFLDPLGSLSTHIPCKLFSEVAKYQELGLQEVHLSFARFRPGSIIKPSGQIHRGYIGIVLG